MVSAPAGNLVGPKFVSRAGTLGVPSLSYSDEEKQSGLRKVVHIQCDVTIKYSKSPPKKDLTYKS